MVGPAAGRVRATAAHALDDGLERDVDLEHVVQLDTGGLHRVGLGNGAGEPVEQEAVGAVGLGDALFHQVDDQVVADQAARLHHRFRLQAPAACRP
jgi:hypothetical protein